MDDALALEPLRRDHVVTAFGEVADRVLIDDGKVRRQKSNALGADGFESAQEKTENQRRGLPNVGIGDNSVIENAILDKDARVGANVRLCNRDKIKNGEGPNFVIREGIVVIPRSAMVLDGAVI